MNRVGWLMCNVTDIFTNIYIEQEALIDKLFKETIQKDQTFRIAFTGLILFPTPLYIFLPYTARHNPILSLLSLTSIAFSTYLLNYPSKVSTQGAKLNSLNGLFALVILISGYVEHKPWKGYDYIWSLPLVSAITTAIVLKWMQDATEHLNELVKAKYKLRGA